MVMMKRTKAFVLSFISPSPVIESRKNFWDQKKFLFHVLIGPFEFQKNFG